MLVCQTAVFCLCKDQMTFAASLRLLTGAKAREGLILCSIVYTTVRSNMSHLFCLEPIVLNDALSQSFTLKPISVSEWL